MSSDSRKYLIGAAATIVAARIQARAAHPVPAKGAAASSRAEPALKDEFLAVYRDLEEALDAVPYAKKDKDKHRENAYLRGDD